MKEKQGGSIPTGLKRWPLKLVKHLADTTCASSSPAGPVGCCPLKVSKGAKMKNQYNQEPHLTKDSEDTNGKVTNSQLDRHKREPRGKRSALSQQVTTRHILTDAYKGIATTTQKKTHKRSTKEVPPWNRQ